jgi:hypothetical protein
MFLEKAKNKDNANALVSSNKNVRRPILRTGIFSHEQSLHRCVFTFSSSLRYVEQSSQNSESLKAAEFTAIGKEN